MEIWILLLSILTHGWMSKNLSITWKQDIHLKGRREKIRERKMKQTTFPWLKLSEISGNVQTCWIELPWLHVCTRDVFWTGDAGLLLWFKWLTHENFPFNRTCPRKECWTHPCEHWEATEQGGRAEKTCGLTRVCAGTSCLSLGATSAGHSARLCTSRRPIVSWSDFHSKINK